MSFLWIFAFLVSRFQSSSADTYLIACGRNNNYTDAANGRNWMGESVTSYSNSGTIGNTIQRSSQFSGDLLYSARFFDSNSAYEFPVSSGRHWVRLYFYPFNFSSFNTNNAIFSVTANNYVLLSNLSIINEVSGLQSGYLFKEYNLKVLSSSLQIKFYPSNASTYAFVNAIEVISVQDNYVDDATLVNAGKQTKFGMSSTAMETMYRLNVGGAYIGPTNDSYLSRIWSSDDEKYLDAAIRGQKYSVSPTIIYPAALPNYTAPPAVFQTARTLKQSNLTWTFDIDSNYTYYVRLLFCELETTVPTARTFDVYLNDMTAFSGMDIVTIAGGTNTALYKDFAVKILDKVSTLKLELSPTSSQLNSSILNGLEIMKMNNSAGSLAGISKPAGFVPNSDTPSARKTKVAVGIIVAGVVGGIIAIAIVVSLIFLLRKLKAKSVITKPASRKPPPTDGNDYSTGNCTGGFSTSQPSIISSGTSSQGGRYFSLSEIVAATNNFDNNLVLGDGGFGKVYLGELYDGTKFAAKRASASSQQGFAEFHTEIDMLSKLRHRHLVSLIGYCDEEGEMVLVYELMAKGTLRSHLYGPDENFVAKVSDFGLSKIGPSLDRTHVSTLVKGSLGYVDPEYYRRQHLTEKSHVYSFGVVLFEVICARPAMDPSRPEEQINIAEWAIQCYKSGLLEDIIDPDLKGQYNVESMHKFVEIAAKCLEENRIDRPSMGDVLWNLESALELQKKSAMPVEVKTQPEEVPRQVFSSEADYSSKVGSETESASAVFSQSFNTEGR